MAVLIRQVALKNYKSIARCKVDLHDMTLLVGPNGSGKSNFVDALRLVADALDTTLEHAIRQRGGINEVRRRSGGHPNHFAIALRLDLGSGRNAHYALQIGAKREGAFVVQKEQATISTEGMEMARFLVEDGELTEATETLRAAPPKITSDRLFLTLVSGLAPFRDLYDALSNLRFYSINPELVKEPQPHDSGDRLDRSGRNLAAVIKRLSEESPERLARIHAYLGQIVPGIEGAEYKSYGTRETLEFRQQVKGQRHPWRFQAANMSDGTLRSLGVLAALFHAVGEGSGPPPLIAIEEPEITIHPAAAGVLMDAIIEAATHAQVLATTHSPELLDHQDMGSDALLDVRYVDGETRITPIDEAARSTIRDAQYTPGELLRKGQLSADGRGLDNRITERDLFGRA